MSVWSLTLALSPPSVVCVWVWVYVCVFFVQFSAEVNAFMCPPLFGWLVGKSELTEGTVDIEVSSPPELKLRDRVG